MPPLVPRWCSWVAVVVAHFVVGGARLGFAVPLSLSQNFTSALDCEKVWSQGSFPSSTLHTLSPLPGRKDEFIGLLSWQGRRISFTDFDSFEAAWPPEDDVTTSGCLVACLRVHHESEGATLCAQSGAVVTLGEGAISTPCSPRDLVMELRTSPPNRGRDRAFYVSGSFWGNISMAQQATGTALPNATADSILCSGAARGCGFVAALTASRDGQVALAGIDGVGAADPWSGNPESTVGRLSPSPHGVWLSGVVFSNTGSFSSGQGRDYTLSSGQQGRGFIAHFHRPNNEDRQVYALSWAQSLGDTRIGQGSPLISGILQSDSCAVVVTDVYKSNTPLLATESEEPASWQEVSAPCVDECSESQNSVVAFVVTLPRNCSMGTADGDRVSVSTWPVSSSPEATPTAVAAWKVDTDTATVAITFVEEDSRAALYEILNDRLTGWFLLAPIPGGVNFGPAKTVTVSDMQYSQSQHQLLVYLQGSSQECLLSAVNDGMQVTGFVSLQNEGCNCQSRDLRITEGSNSTVAALTGLCGGELSADSAFDKAASSHSFGCSLAAMSNFMIPAALAPPKPASWAEASIEDIIAFVQYRLDTYEISQQKSPETLRMILSSIKKIIVGDVEDSTLGRVSMLVYGILEDAILSGAPPFPKPTLQLFFDILARTNDRTELIQVSRGTDRNATNLLVKAVMLALEPGGTVTLQADDGVELTVAISTPQRPTKTLKTKSSYAEVELPMEALGVEQYIYLVYAPDVPLLSPNEGKLYIKGYVNMGMAEAQTLQAIPVANLSNPIELNFTLQKKRPGRDQSTFRDRRFACEWHDGEGDGTATGNYSVAGTYAMPMYVPRYVSLYWTPGYVLPPPGEKPKLPVWSIESTEVLDGGRKFDCQTVVSDKVYWSGDPFQSTYGAVSFNGSDCYWFVDPDDKEPQPLPVKGRSCMWDIVAQIFVGPDCVPAPPVVRCLTNRVSKFRVSMTQIPTTILAFREQKILFVEDSNSRTSSTFFSTLFLMLGGSFFMLAVFWIWEKHRNRRILKQLMQADHAFQPDGKWDTTVRKFNLDYYRDKTWIWCLETHVFRVLKDDMNVYAELTPDDQLKFQCFTTATVKLWAFMGLPFGRGVVAVPASRCLPWCPIHKPPVDAETWRTQALGTSMVMAFLHGRRILSPKLFNEQMEKQEAYFAGCHPMGFLALVRRWKAMLSSNMHKRGWYERGCIWRIVWLRRPDGLWDLTPCFAKAVGVGVDPLFTWKGGLGGGSSTIKSQLPEALEVYFFGNPDLALQVWCTFLAEAFLVSSPVRYSEFTGLEPSNANGNGVSPRFAHGTLMSVCAKYAIRFHMEKHHGPEFFASASPWHVNQNAEAGIVDDKAPFESLDDLIHSISEDAKQAIKSWRNLRTTRLRYAMALMEQQAKWIVPEAARKKRDAVEKEQAKGEERHIERSMKDEIRFLEDLQQMKRVQWLRRMQGIQYNYAPSPMFRFLNFMRNTTSAVLYNVFHCNRFLRVLTSSFRDGFSVSERSMSNSTSLVSLLAISLWVFREQFLTCCDKQRDVLNCGVNTTQDCLRQLTESFTTPNRIHHTLVVNETVTRDATCSWLEDHFAPPGFTCRVFPDQSNLWHLTALGLIIAVAAFPLKVVLHFLFTIRNGSHASLMKKRRPRFLRHPCFVWLSCLFPQLKTSRELRKEQFEELLAAAPPSSVNMEEANKEAMEEAKAINEVPRI